MGDFIQTKNSVPHPSSVHCSMVEKPSPSDPRTEGRQPRRNCDAGTAVIPCSTPGLFPVP